VRNRLSERAIPTEGAGTAHSLRRYGTNLSRYLTKRNIRKAHPPDPRPNTPEEKLKKRLPIAYFEFCCRRYSLCGLSSGSAFSA